MQSLGRRDNKANHGGGGVRGDTVSAFGINPEKSEIQNCLIGGGNTERRGVHAREYSTWYLEPDVKIFVGMQQTFLRTRERRTGKIRGGAQADVLKREIVGSGSNLVRSRTL